ncbi:MAG: zinc-dependent peptidase [Acidimicrobiales bacterium]|nr:zinc-dependent peptidase [Acidimicrobiales bacterium]
MRFPWSRRSAVPDDWRELAARHVADWGTYDPPDQERLGALMAELIDGHRWEPARGFELTDRMRVVIAIQASRLVLGLEGGTDWYERITTIVVHRSVLRFDRVEPGPVEGTEECGVVHLDGQTSYRGPVVISWDAASRNARHPTRGRDVVMHEFAHVLDMADGVVDGTPPLPPSQLERWVDVFTDAFDRLEEHGSEVLDDYAGTDAGEFFAVSTETFFTRPLQLAEAEPELYDLLRAFYRQDPAAAATDR